MLAEEAAPVTGGAAGQFKLLNWLMRYLFSAVVEGVEAAAEAEEEEVQWPWGRRAPGR